jgi:uncharacterized protein YbbC (DUF1343 family)
MVKLMDKKTKEIIEKIEKLVYQINDLVNELEGYVITLVMMIEKNEKENEIIAKTKDINELKKKLEE